MTKQSDRQVDSRGDSKTFISPASTATAKPSDGGVNLAEGRITNPLTDIREPNTQQSLMAALRPSRDILQFSIHELSELTTSLKTVARKSPGAAKTDHDKIKHLPIIISAVKECYQAEIERHNCSEVATAADRAFDSVENNFKNARKFGRQLDQSETLDAGRIGFEGRSRTVQADFEIEELKSCANNNLLKLDDLQQTLRLLLKQSSNFGLVDKSIIVTEVDEAQGKRLFCRQQLTHILQAVNEFMGNTERLLEQLSDQQRPIDTKKIILELCADADRILDGTSINSPGARDAVDLLQRLSSRTEYKITADQAERLDQALRQKKLKSVFQLLSPIEIRMVAEELAEERSPQPAAKRIANRQPKKL